MKKNMQEEIKKLIIKRSVNEIIDKSANNKKITSLIKKHENKIHFIPPQYRILGGLLQSMNIKFENFIEILMKNLIENEDKYEILEKYSGKKSNVFLLSKTNEELIDRYITQCQINENMDLETSFRALCDEIFENNIKNSNYIHFKHDIDLLFKNKQNGKMYYLEIKYNDDHDTGKFVDINRKFIKTYAYLLNEFNFSNSQDLVPILFFFNNKKLKGNIYIPESTNIKRGKKFFDEFLSMSYELVDSYLTEFSKSDEIIKKINNLYEKIMTLYA